MNLPARKKKQRMGLREEEGKCPGHCKWVRQSFACAILGLKDHICVGVIEAHHVVSRGAGGTDLQVVPLCSGAHSEGHAGGWETFAGKYGVNLEKMAADLWNADTYHRTRYQQRMT